MPPGLIRIIAGKWRGRQLQVPAVKGLRPTPDRVRETLFNWLTNMTALDGVRCLDLFAGSGVLGFEALSRGASYVEFIDQSADVVALLRNELTLFKVEKDQAHVYQAKAPEQIQTATQPFDIVFLDPPYQTDLLLPSCDYLEKNKYLAPCAYIYLEAHDNIKDNDLPSNWRLLKSKTAGQVHYHLAYREEP